MVFTREGIIYNKANPALYASNGVQATHSVSLKRDRIRRNKMGRQVSPPNSWVCRVGEEYHLLPRGRKTSGSSEANSFSMTNTEMFQRGDLLTLLEPHTTLDTAGLADGSNVSLTVESTTDSFTVDGASGVDFKTQVVNFINFSTVLSNKVYAIASPTADSVSLFAKGQYLYTVEATGVTTTDAMLVPKRPIGRIDRLGTEKDDYYQVTVRPIRSFPGAIATTDIPDGAVIDCPIYHEIMGLFNDQIDFERTSEVLVAPIHGAVGMNVFALSHFDETLRKDFPKITFVNETTVQ